MIQANELRIGNWVIRLTNNNMFVQYEKVSLIPMHDLQSSYVKPIPLTEEILLKCGFEKSIIYNNTYHITIETLNGSHDIFIDISANVLILSMIELASFLYLHQLQNIIHALTGQELNIEL